MPNSPKWKFHCRNKGAYFQAHEGQNNGNLGDKLSGKNAYSCGIFQIGPSYESASRNGNARAEFGNSGPKLRSLAHRVQRFRPAHKKANSSKERPNPKSPAAHGPRPDRVKAKNSDKGSVQIQVRSTSLQLAQKLPHVAGGHLGGTCTKSRSGNAASVGKLMASKRLELGPGASGIAGIEALHFCRLASPASQSGFSHLAVLRPPFPRSEAPSPGSVNPFSKRPTLPNAAPYSWMPKKMRACHLTLEVSNSSPSPML